MHATSHDYSFARRTKRSFRIAVASVCVYGFFSLMATSAFSQDDKSDDAASADQADLSLIERSPFDKIHIQDTRENKVVVYEVEPLPFPNRRVPTNARPGDKLQFRRLKDPHFLYAVVWTKIVKIELYEQMVHEEAQQLLRGGDYEKAYEYFVFLLKNYPSTPDLSGSLETLLYLDCGRLYNAGNTFVQQKRIPEAKKSFQEALAVIEELNLRNKDFRLSVASPTLMQVMGNIVDALLAIYIEHEQNYPAARMMLDRIAKEYADKQTAVVGKWRGKLQELALSVRKEVEDHLAAGRGRDAHRAVRSMLNILPDLQGGEALAAEVADKFPLVLVGVTQPAVHNDPRSLDNWAARRAGRLTHRLLMEYASPGFEGGQYISPVGTYEVSEDRKTLTIRLNPTATRPDVPVVNGYDVSQRLLALSDPASAEYTPAWSRLLDRVNIDQIYNLTAELRYPHVLPEAMLQTYLEPRSNDEKQTDQDGIYAVSKRSDEEITYVPNPRYQLDPSLKRPELAEIYFAESQKAVEALERGEIDVLDRVFPSDVQQLRKDPSIVVGHYRLPTIHMLVPKPGNPFLDNLQFRRAILYGIDRELILNQLLLSGQEIAGCRVAAGPFPSGIEESDPYVYAFNAKIRPVPYDRVLGITYAQVADNQVAEAALKQGEEVTERPTLKLGHPANDVIRIACQSIVRQLKMIDINCELHEFPPGVTEDTENVCDLVYVELLMWEPVVDARRLLAAEGIVGSDLTHVEAGLRKLDEAGSWADARRRLSDLIRISFDESVVIPLWQLTDHYARRKQLSGLGQSNPPLWLYQEVDKWRIVQGGS